MRIAHQAERIRLFQFNTPQMRAFHMSWIAFFLCFFAWFGVAPLMPVVREELRLTQSQVGWCVIASVAITVLARILIGRICDRWGPRRTYAALLIVGSLPVMGIGLAHDFTTFLVFRLLIGAIGASFVVTQYHMSIMFAPNCVGTANATTAGWGNLGGGVTQLAMPAAFALLVGVCGWSEAFAWRGAMALAGAVCCLAGVAYYLLTQDAPDGDFRELRAAGKLPDDGASRGNFWLAAADYRVWALFVAYGACFGIELTIDNVAALYFTDYFDLTLTQAGVAAGAFGAMNLFARALGGIVADRCGARWGFGGRVRWLFAALFCEGVALMFFSRMTSMPAAVATLLLTGLFVKMANGATYAVVPLLNRKTMGATSGIVGAGGNVGAVLAGFWLRGSADWRHALLILGAAVVVCSFAALLVRSKREADTSPFAPSLASPWVKASRLPATVAAAVDEPVQV